MRNAFDSENLVSWIATTTCHLPLCLSTTNLINADASVAHGTSSPQYAELGQTGFAGPHSGVGNDWVADEEHGAVETEKGEIMK